MHRDPRKRLGARKGVEEIKSHAFFSGINWDDVMKKYLLK